MITVRTYGLAFDVPTLTPYAIAFPTVVFWDAFALPYSLPCIFNHAKKNSMMHLIYSWGK